MSDRNYQPFENSRPIAQRWFLIFIVIGLLLLLIGNSGYLDSVLIFRAEASNILSNFGFAVIVLAAFQWVFDYKHREKFFRDIQAQIISDQSINKSGIKSVIENSKNIDYTNLILKAKVIDIGVTYSDRFLKDYFNTIKKNNDLSINIYYCDENSEDLFSAITVMTGQDVSKIQGHYENINSLIEKLKADCVSIKSIRIRAIPKYSFLRFDKNKTFLIPSTFAARQSIVPAIEIEGTGFFHEFVNDCIEECERQNELDRPPTERNDPKIG
tara:strand:+ start:89 stop:898 length:810 start_codon:yes stop_codon:yes gene_type:complete